MVETTVEKTFDNLDRWVTPSVKISSNYDGHLLTLPTRNAVVEPELIACYGP